MPFYEIVFIAKQSLTPIEVDTLSDKFKKIIEDHKGKLVSKEYWGLRSLAYKIKKNQRGHYVLLNIDSDFSAIEEIERVIGFDENIIRRATFKVKEFPEVSDLLVSLDAKDYKNGKSEIIKTKNKEKASKEEIVLELMDEV